MVSGIHTGIAYAAYGLSAYARVISITAMVRVIRSLTPFVRALLDRFPILERLITDIQLRAEVSLYLSILLKILYVGIEIYAGLRGSSASKVITFVSALVTMLSLETAMISSFGRGDTVFRQRMISATGIAFLLIVLLMAVYMICRSGRTERQEGSA